MKNFQKGLVAAPIVIILTLLLIGGAYIVFKNQTKQKINNKLNAPPANNEKTQNNQTINNFENWDSHTNKELGFTISHPIAYHVFYDNLVNYDETKYERGNSDGVKIQVQRRNQENFGYDLSTTDGIKNFTDKLNADRVKNDTIDNSSSTPIIPFLLGDFKFKNQVLSGPGGKFDIYYAFTSNNTYHMVLVWGENNDKETVNKILSAIKFSNTKIDQKIYQNLGLGFSFKYPFGWNVVVKENDLSLGSLVSLKFTNGQTNEIDRDEFLGLISCFAGMNNVDPLYLGNFHATESIKVDGVSTSIYFDQNRGLETLKFYIPLIKQDSKRCGIFFQSFGNLTEDKKDIITSLDFTSGFESFINAVAKQFQTNPPTQG